MTSKPMSDLLDFNLSDINFDKLQGLLPAIIQDASTRDVLMLGFMNPEAFSLTIKTGKVHFWSRTRKRIWMKGEESGNILLLQEVCLDCDRDALLCLVEPRGPTCHTGNVSCFDDSGKQELALRMNSLYLEQVFDLIEDRINKPIKGSYVASLVEKGQEQILRKIGEEAVEVLLAGQNTDRKAFIHEITDLLFHVMVLLAIKGESLEAVYQELFSRNKQKERERNTSGGN
jgi:phosphoribosyl-ATP pyrophosphohydrolase/phosphoribosyl-AMP cyclohydrolase